MDATLAVNYNMCYILLVKLVKVLFVINRSFQIADSRNNFSFEHKWRYLSLKYEFVTMVLLSFLGGKELSMFWMEARADYLFSVPWKDTIN